MESEGISGSSPVRHVAPCRWIWPWRCGAATGPRLGRRPRRCRRAPRPGRIERHHDALAIQYLVLLLNSASQAARATTSGAAYPRVSGEVLEKPREAEPVVRVAVGDVDTRDLLAETLCPAADLVCVLEGQ
jgi:hypothetical protein